MMRQRIPRWPRLQQEPQQKQEPQQSQPRLHHHHPQQQQRMQLSQQQHSPLALDDHDDDNDDDGGNSSDETYYSSRHYVVSRPLLPFSFRTRATAPPTTSSPTSATTPWSEHNIAIRVVNAESSSCVVDDDTVPTQMQLSDNEGSAFSDDDYNFDGFTVEGDEDTVYSINTIETRDEPVEHAIQEFTSNKNGPLEKKEDDEGMIPNISDLISNSCLSTDIGKELLETYTDARDALHQVLHAFTLGEGEINCVCGRVDDAKTEFLHS